MNRQAADADERMLREQIIARGVRDTRVLDAFRSVPRAHFVPASLQSAAWDDSPLPIGHGQTISQPYIVAYMTELLDLRGGERVLELGAGCGYQTAILSKLATRVYAAELEADLAESARENLEKLAIGNVEIRCGDGVSVFTDEAPFDAILSAAAPLTIPQALVEQLGDGGRLVIPAGPADAQSLWLVTRRGDSIRRQELDAVRFVPLRRRE